MKRSRGREKIKRRLVPPLFFALFALFCLSSFLHAGSKALQEKSQAQGIKNPVVLKGPVVAITLDSAINPASLDLLKRGLRRASKENASLFLILLDTPGGLVASLRKMVQLVMSSPVPVGVFVYPPGARAASAGALLTISADIAAMAPGTNIGAAHPVAIGRKMESNTTMAEKAENDLAAFARSIAIKRGRNAKWAEDAVRKSISTTSQDALKLHVIDVVAKDIPDLLKSIEGRRIKLADGRVVVIKPLSFTPIFVKETLREKVLRVIADPNVAYILLMIGMVGIYFELAHPGVILPGTAGSICLLLALYALHTLSASTTAILLILFAFVLFVLELFITSHGILAVSGAISLTVGSLMLFDLQGAPGVSASVLWPTLLFVILFFAAIAILAARAALSRPKTGMEALIGETGVIRKEKGRGKYIAFVHGELWEAEGPEGLHAGREITVAGIKGLKLKIKPKGE